MEIICSCGCGERIPAITKLGTPARYKHGHNTRPGHYDFRSPERVRKIRAAKLGKARPDMAGNQFRKGIPPVNPFSKGVRIAPQTEFGKGHTPWNKGKPHLAREKNPNWKGGLIPASKILRHTHEYRNWRDAVYQRDDWTCQFCDRRGVRLEPHHIKMFAYYPALRYDIDNGITLCYECHQLTKSPDFNDELKAS
jgi:hypothetical protein